MLPIEMFDSIKFEDMDRPPEEWATPGPDAALPGGVVPYYMNGSWKWRHCEVHGYDPEKKTFK